MRKEKPFTVWYRPDFASTHTLYSSDDLADALEAAACNSRMYYGECSAITVSQGRKNIVTIPRRQRAA